MVKAVLHPKPESPLIPREIYSHFAEHLGSCIYGGLWVGEDSEIPNVRGIRSDVVEALKAIHVPAIRWPGGCFADEYHWMDGIGPRSERPSIYNSHWGGVVENNHFGTHEFFDLCSQVGCSAYVCGNVGSGTVREMSQWVEYITSAAESPMANLRRQNGQDEPWKIAHFGVGNESWGCGGNMRPEYYADLYRQYATFVRTYGPIRPSRIACGPNGRDLRWTEVLMENAAFMMDGLSLHYYTVLRGEWPPSGSATKFTKDEWHSVLSAAFAMDELIGQHSSVMDRFDPEKRVNLVIDEWGTWHPSEPGTNPGFLFQQNTMRDALTASLHFDIFHRHCERVRMTNIAQMVNVLQAVILTDGPRMVRTPTYWAFDLYSCHQRARRIDFDLEGQTVMGEGAGHPDVSMTASEKDGIIYVSASCLDPHSGRSIEIGGLPSSARVRRARALAAADMQDCNTFDQPDRVRPVEVEARIISGTACFDLPAGGIVTLELES